MTRDVEGVVAKLTEAQRRAILGASPLMNGGNLLYFAAYRDGGKLVESLVELDLAIRTINGVRLNASGTAVRHLLAQDKSQ